MDLEKSHRELEERRARELEMERFQQREALHRERRNEAIMMQWERPRAFQRFTRQA